ncbi:ankyrin repeat protein [Fonsecaea pedrosoi]|nr:ankyrin repeat protein [Fonsecaea pedrosoi]
MGIHEDARRGTLTEARLEKYLDADWTILDQRDSVEGLTPLGAATVGGHADEVLLLLKSGAKADILSRDGATSLLLAASRTEKNRARIIQLLLAKTPSNAIDATTAAVGNNTPLMFVVLKKDAESIRLLRKARASVTLTNDDGHTAKFLADSTYDRVVIRALNPEKEQSDFSKLIDMVVGLLLFVVAWVNKVADDVVRRAYGIHIDLNEAWDQAVNRGEDPTTVEFVEKVDEVVKDSPIERFFEGKEDFVREVAKNAVELQNDTTTSLGSSELLPKTIKVSLHQQVIYCDDSGSMRREDRWDSQTNLVERIAKVTTRVLPEGEGVALRFINQDVPNSSNLSLEDVANILGPMKWSNSGNTDIGTNLRSKILQPLVYDKLDSVPRRLERPLLISILTDGGPEPEPEPTLKNAIVECSQRLDAANYPRESVKFMIGQIGTSKFATRFLQTIRESAEIADMVYCTSDQLDERFKREYDNQANLDRWLIETLFEPLKDRKKKLEGWP